MPPRDKDILDSFRLCFGINGSFVASDVKITDDALKRILDTEILGTEKEEKMNKLEGRDICSIEIFRNGDKVIARAYEKSPYSKYNVIHEAEAKCGPNDIFDFGIGAKLAVDRLFEGYDMTPKPKRKPYNGLIYIYEYPGVSLKSRSIYRVKNGVISGCKFGGDAPYIFYDMSDTDLSREIHRQIYGNPLSDMTIIAHFVNNDIISINDQT